MRVRSILPALPLLLGACASAGPPQAPPNVDPAHVHFSTPEVEVGDPAVDFTLPLVDGTGEVTLSALRGRPVVLIFGSTT